LNPTLQNPPQAPAQPEPAQPAPVPKTISAMQRAANSINQSFALEKKFPVLDDYVFSEFRPAVCKQQLTLLRRHFVRLRNARRCVLDAFREGKEL
jgi:hypothetical protein